MHARPARLRAPWLALALLAGTAACNLLPEGPAEPNCSPRRPFWLDADGDGYGDAAGPVYIGCEAPEGYTDVLPRPDTDPGDTADTADSADTADTDAGDSDTDDTDAPTDTDDSDTPVDSDSDAETDDSDTDGA